MKPDSTSLQAIAQGSAVFVGQDELRERLAQGKRLTVKLGVDPTRPDLTFGHWVVLGKLRQLQDLGHQAILLIGDYTAQIGDPSGRSSTRPLLTEEEVQHNAQTYLSQAFKILDPQQTVVRRNSEWLKPLSFSDALQLASKMTVARMLEREDFAKRYAAKSPISIVEFLYPLLQGYDSVALQADLELGGTDQLFNLLVGRALQKDYGQPEQAVLCMPLLVGLDGVQKMSKSAGNYIALSEDAQTMLGKVMSISDTAMLDYYRLLLGYSPERLEALQHSQHPMAAKKQLALELVARLHGPELAQAALAHFEQVFSRKELPDHMPVVSLAQLGLAVPCRLMELLAEALGTTGLLASKKEVKRLLEQGAIKLDGLRVQDPMQMLEAPGAEGAWVVQAGKRVFVRVVP